LELIYQGLEKLALSVWQVAEVRTFKFSKNFNRLFAIHGFNYCYFERWQMAKAKYPN